MSGGGGTGWTIAVARLLGRLAAGWSLVLAVMLALGFLITQVLDGHWPLTGEDELTDDLVALRTPGGDHVTEWLSRLGETEVVVAACAVAFVVLRRVLHRWREALLVAGATIGQSVVFLFTTLVIDRRRPDVEQLDVAPPTSSFPSGHTGASLVLCLALWVVVRRRARPGVLRTALTVALPLVPAAVATGRLYRGMHHPSDVVGSVVNAVLVLLVTIWTVRRTPLPEDASAGGGRSDVAPGEDRGRHAEDDREPGDHPEQVDR